MKVQKDIFTVIIGGKAGQGIRKSGYVIAELFNQMGRGVFQMDDYPSLIKGGHNFSVVSTSLREIRSHYMKADLVILFDQRSYELHKEHIAKNGIIVIDEGVEGNGIPIPIMKEARKYKNAELISGISSIAILCATIGISREKMKKLIERNYKSNLGDNISYALEIYDITIKKIGVKFSLQRGKKKRKLLTGNEAIALGAYAAGLDIYIAYPMTPSTSILHFFAKNAKKLGIAVMQPENEIAVANMAIGATFAGAKTMVGSSGGGFALMQEAFSMAGMVEAPVLFVLSSRPGPSTGVPTYTEQADLYFALNQGHGEFPRIVASPGSIEEAFYLAGEMLNLVWKFQTPGVLMTDKHLSESRMNVDLILERIKEVNPLLYNSKNYKRYLITKDGISPLLFPPSEEVIKWNSYEHDEYGITTEKPEMIEKMHDKRRRKRESLVKEMKKIHTVNEYGNGNSIIFTFGSTTMSVVETIENYGIDSKVVQPIYLEPFPTWEIEKYKGMKCMVIEQNSTGQFSRLLMEKAGIKAESLKKYDGRPFDVEWLAEKIKRWLNER